MELFIEHTVWNNGCASQFKCARTWFHVSRYQALTKSVGLPRGCVIGYTILEQFMGKTNGMGLEHMSRMLFWAKQVKTIGSTKLQNVLDVCNFSQASMGKAHLAYLKAQ
jgi:hypothetical protein